MKFVILHGTGEGPDMWLPWLKTELEKLGHEVWMPTLPNPETPDWQAQSKFLLESDKLTPETTVIGHSAACPLIFSTLQQMDTSIKKAVLVAPDFPQPGKEKPIWQDKYDLAKIKQNCGEFVFIASDNDPWGANDKLARPYFDQVGGMLIVVKDGGHFGSNTYKQPMYEFPLLLKLIL